MDVVVKRYIDIRTIIINFPYSTCISSFFSSSIHTIFLLFSSGPIAVSVLTRARRRHTFDGLNYGYN